MAGIGATAWSRTASCLTRERDRDKSTLVARQGQSGLEIHIKADTKPPVNPETGL